MTTYDLVQRSEEVLETAKRINGELTQQRSTQRRLVHARKRLGQAQSVLMHNTDKWKYYIVRQLYERVDISRVGVVIKAGKRTQWPLSEYAIKIQCISTIP